MQFLSLGTMRTPTLVWATSLFGLCVLVASCGDDATGDTSTDDGTAGDGDGDGDGDVEPWEPIPARGNISLSHVVVNQAVDVPIAVNGEWVGPEERNTYVVGNRDTLMRAFWEIPEDWAAREITAVLVLEFTDGTSETTEQDVMIDGPSFAGDFNRSFMFQILADDFEPGIKYHMSLWESGPGFDDLPESTTVIESPIGGTQQIGVQPEPAELKVVMVPVVYNDGNGCNTDTSTLTPVEEQRYIDYLHEHYPVKEVVWDFRRDTPFQWDTPLTSLSQLWEPLRDLRAAEQADPNVYYYALVNTCSPGIDDAAGIAPGLASNLKTAAFERVSSGVWLDGQDYAYHVMVHELGHNHGRAHVFCAGGDAAGTDPAYPYDDGIIGVWGFGIRLFELHSPTATRDFMTYCSPTWVSDWSWSKAYLRIRTLTSWDYEGAPANNEPEGEVLIGLLLEDGTEEWSTSPGAREAEFFSSGEVVSFDYGDAVIDSPTNVQILDDGTTMITTTVPRAQNKFESASRIDAGKTRSIVLQTPETRSWSF